MLFFGFMTCEVDKNQPLYQEVEKRFQESGMRLITMTEVSRISDMDVFEQEKGIMLEHLKMKQGGATKVEDLRIVDLYHGTSESSEHVLSEGLDVRTLRHFGHFGRGVYFSDDPAFARIEAESRGGSKVIYRCKVILGNSKVYPPEQTDPTLMREPREFVDGKMVIYDSAEGNISGFTQYAVYERRRILIQHVLHYEAHGSPPCLPSLPEKRLSADDRSGSGSDDSSNGSSGESSFHSPGEDEDGLMEMRKKKKKKVKVEGHRRKKTSTDPNGVIRSALSHLMNLKCTQPEGVFDELLTLFYKTYIEWPVKGDGRSKAKGAGRGPVIDSLVEEFRVVTSCKSDVEAKIFLAVNDGDVNEAVLNYFTATG